MTRFWWSMTGVLKTRQSINAVARQYIGSAGKDHHYCQIGVFVSSYAAASRPRLHRSPYLPKEWIDARFGMKAARVRGDYVLRDEAAA